MGIQAPKASKGSVMGAILVLGFFLLSLGGGHSAHGATATSMVCVTKSRSVLILNSKKACDAGQTKLILSPDATPKMCISKTNSALAYTSCSSKHIAALSVSANGYLPACINSKTRAVSWRRTKCVAGTKSATLMMPEPVVATFMPTTSTVIATNTPDTTTPLTTSSTSLAPFVPSTTLFTTSSSSTSTTAPIATTSTTSLPASTSTTTTTSPPTTTTTTTTTTVAPAAPNIALFLAGASPIREGDTTYLWASYSNGTGVVDHGFGSLGSISQRDVSPTVTTTYTLTVTNSVGQSVTASVTIDVIPATTTTTTTTIPTGTTTTSTSTTTTTTVPVVTPASITYFFSGVNTINQGETTYLWGYYTGTTAVVDNGVGAFPSGLAINVSPNVTTTYTLTVTNSAGQSVTATATITVVPSGGSTTTTTVPTGTTTTTTVAPVAPNIALFLSGASPINEGGTSYLWASYSGGTGVVDNGIGSLSNITQRDISPTVTTTYTLTVTNSAGQTATASVTITVIPSGGATTTTTVPSSTTTSTTTSVPVSSPVSITSQPENQGPTLGDTATFSVTATGTGSLTYQWYRDGTEIVGATARTYSTDVEATYKVRVTNTLNGVANSVDSSSRTLVVNAGSLTPPNATEYVTQGLTRSLWVSVSHPGNVSTAFQWTKDGVNISGATSNGYSASQTGDYRLVVTCTRNGATKVLTSDPIHVTAVAMPVISSFDSASSNIPVGGSTQLVPVFTGGTGVMTPGNISVNSGDHVTVSPTATTNYTLTVSNAAGTGPSRTYRITVTTGSFVNTANDSSVGRGSGATTITLNDGRVLVYGNTGSGHGTRIADIFNPVTNSFTRTGDTVLARQESPGILLSNGKVLVSGGTDLQVSGWVGLNTAEVFDPATGTWTQQGNMTQSRRRHFMVRLTDGRVLVGGGIDTKSVDIYDPVTGQFTRVADMPEVREGTLAAKLPNGNVMLFGGAINGVASESTLIYDVQNNSWSYSAAHIPVPFKFGNDIVTLNDGRIMIAGGAYQDNTCMSAIQIYDPTTQTFTSSSSMSVRRCYLSLELLSDGKVLIIGGVDGFDSFNPIWSSVEVFDPSTGISQIQANLMASGRYRHSSAVMGDGRVLIIDGGAADQIFTE